MSHAKGERRNDRKNFEQISPSFERFAQFARCIIAVPKSEVFEGIRGTQRRKRSAVTLVATHSNAKTKTS